MNKEMLQACLSSDPDAKLSDVVARIIYDEIVNLRIAPGTKLNINQIAKELGVSRTPVQEALLKLIPTRLVVQGCSSGFYTITLTAERFVELSHARAAIESEAAFLCAEIADEALITTLTDTAVACAKAVETEDMSALTIAERRFHYALMNGCGNGFLRDGFAAMMPEMTIYQNFLMRCVPAAPASLRRVTAKRQEGAANAIAMGMPEVARQLMRENLLHRVAFSAFFCGFSMDCNCEC